MRSIILLLLLLLVSLVASQTTSKLTFVGAGFGGLYGAFRLQNDSSSGYLPSDVWLFESSGRAGGRALSFQFPTRNKVSLGAHRHDPETDIIVDSVIKKVLKLNTTCQFRNQECVYEGGYYTFFRNWYNGNLAKSSNIPYYLDKTESWNQRIGPKDLAEEIMSYYPFIASSIDSLQSLDPSIRYPAIRQAIDTLRTYLVDGLHPNQLTIRTLLNRSSEYWELLISAWGEAYYILDIPIYVVVRDELLSGYSKGSLEVIVDADGFEMGYQAKDERLAQLLSSRGVNVRYNKRLSSIKRNAGGSLALAFSDGTTHTTDKLILNIAYNELMQLSRDSVIFSEAGDDLKRMYGLFSPTPSMKAYGYYDDAWWYPSFQQGEVATDTAANYYDLRDSAVECVGTSCKGWVNMAYPSGEYYEYFKNIRSDSSPLTYIYANTTDPMQRRWFYDFNYQFVRSFCNATKQLRCNIPPPSIIAMGIWDQAWHDFLPSNYLGGLISNVTSVLAEGVYWANEANSYKQGWAEGSAVMMERILHMKFGLDMPTWLDNPYWYQNVVNNPLI